MSVDVHQELGYSEVYGRVEAVHQSHVKSLDRSAGSGGNAIAYAQWVECQCLPVSKSAQPVRDVLAHGDFVELVLVC